MVQLLKFDKSRVDDTKDAQYFIISGSNSVKFFLKRVLYLILFIYSTLFLAVAIPFVKTPCIPIYFIGGMITSVFIIRFINHIAKYTRFKSGGIIVNKTGIEVSDKRIKLNIPAEEITYLELNLLGNLVVREKDKSTSFPLTLINEDEREKLLTLFQDMSPKRTALYRKVWEFFDAIVVALVLAVHIIQFIIQAYFIPTGSMKDTLLVGDHLFVEKITYGPIIPAMLGMDKAVHLHWLGIREIQRGDIVIFKPPHELEKDYIKRVIAISGDRFEIDEDDGVVILNGKKFDEPYVKGRTTYHNFNSEKKDDIEGIVPEGKIVVLGDNRENSQDGRYFGYLDIERINGRAFILYWNTSQIMNLDFSRFGLIR